LVLRFFLFFPGRISTYFLGFFIWFLGLWSFKSKNTTTIKWCFLVPLRIFRSVTFSAPWVQFHLSAALMVPRNSSQFSTTHDFIPTNVFRSSTASFYCHSSAFIFSTSSI
jgi:hypothetical protein